MKPKERTCEGYQLLSPDRHYAKCGYKRRRLTDLKVTTHMPLSSKRSVTGALQASDAGSSPASGTSRAFKSLELAESKYKTKNSLW